MKIIKHYWLRFGLTGLLIPIIGSFVFSFGNPLAALLILNSVFGLGVPLWLDRYGLPNLEMIVWFVPIAWFLIGALLGFLYSKLRNSLAGKFWFYMILLVGFVTIMSIYYQAQTNSSALSTANDTHDFRVCDRLPDNHELKEDCYFSVGSNVYDYSVCDGIDQKYKHICVSVVASDIGDCDMDPKSDLCYLSQISTIAEFAYEGRSCSELYYSHAIQQVIDRCESYQKGQTTDEDLCGILSREDSQAECLRNIVRIKIRGW